MALELPDLSIPLHWHTARKTEAATHWLLKPAAFKRFAARIADADEETLRGGKYSCFTLRGIKHVLIAGDLAEWTDATGFVEAVPGLLLPVDRVPISRRIPIPRGMWLLLAPDSAKLLPEPDWKPLMGLVVHAATELRRLPFAAPRSFEFDTFEEPPEPIVEAAPPPPSILEEHVEPREGFFVRLRKSLGKKEAKAPRGLRETKKRVAEPKVVALVDAVEHWEERCQRAILERKREDASPVWRKLASLYDEQDRRREAAFAFRQVVYAEPEPDVETLREWLRHECRAAGVIVRIGEMEAVAWESIPVSQASAFAAGLVAAGRVGKLPADRMRIKDFLLHRFDLLPVRLAWMTVSALAGDDSLYLAHAHDRARDRLRRVGLAGDADLPGFLRRVPPAQWLRDKRKAFHASIKKLRQSNALEEELPVFREAGFIVNWAATKALADLLFAKGFRELGLGGQADELADAARAYLRKQPETLESAKWLLLQAEIERPLSEEVDDWPALLQAVDDGEAGAPSALLAAVERLPFRSFTESGPRFDELLGRPRQIQEPHTLNRYHSVNHLRLARALATAAARPAFVLEPAALDWLAEREWEFLRTMRRDLETLEARER